MTDIEQLLTDHLNRRGGAVRVDDDLEAILDPTHAIVRNAHPRGSGRRMLPRVAAAVVVGLGLAALAWQTSAQPSAPADSSPASTAPATSNPTRSVDGGARTLVPPDLAALGLRLTSSGLLSAQRTAPDGRQRRIYAAADDPDAPTRMVLVDVKKDLNGGAVTCQHVDGAEPFDVPGATGWTCTSGPTLTAGWAVDGAVAELWAGTAVSRDELITLVQSLRPARTKAADDGAPPVQLEPRPLPAGWVTVLDGDVPYTQQVTETAWVATASGDDGDPRQLWVKTWTGVDDDLEALYAINPPIQSQRVTVRGHPGYLYVSTQRRQNGPLQIQISWVESPGFVVSLVADDLGPAEQLLAGLDTWTSVTGADFDQAIAD